MAPVRAEHVTFLSLDQAAKPPTGGLFSVYVDAWWVHVPGLGVMLYRRYPSHSPAPQCNTDRRIVELVARDLYAETWPTVEARQVSLVMIPHRCET
jgi:hypothetical protein